MSNASSEETWLPVPNYDQYEVSNHGKVRSVDFLIEYTVHGEIRRRIRKGRVLKQINNEGYRVVNLSKQNKIKQWGVHQLVAAAFIGPCPENMTVDHIDCDKTNNRPENLEYVTLSENTARQHKNGLIKYGTSENRLTEAEENLIFSLKGVIPRPEIAAKFNISTRKVLRVWKKCKENQRCSDAKPTAGPCPGQ